ncbi:MAG: LptF/LptG family permease [Sulfurospirillaceae bacterium]|nr:LptF/LptG family permease [Sulfurospirillaceae bacterium]
MRLFEKYVIKNYVSNVFVIFVSLELFYVGVDWLSNYKTIPDSANLQILYFLFQALSAINYVLPLSIVFGMIVTKFALIKSNELICMYASGITKRSLVIPFFLTSLVLTLLYIGLNCTPFVYAYEYGSNLRKYNRISNGSGELFLKNGDQYVFVKKLDPLKKTVFGITIFDASNGDVQKITKAQSGYFVDNFWLLQDVNITDKPIAKSLSDIGLKTTIKSKMTALENFKPKIIDNIYQGQYILSILDAIEAMTFFEEQGVNTSRIKAMLFSQLFPPLFAPFLIVILYFNSPISSRYFNTAFLSFVFAFVTLAVWGGLFLLSKLSLNTVIPSEIGILAPIIVLGLLALHFYYKEK